MRLHGKTAGAELRAYIAPQAEITIRVVAGASRAASSTPRGRDQGHALHDDVRQSAAGGRHGRQRVGGSRRQAVADEHSRRSRVEMAREDIASAASRTSAFSIPGDESVTIPSIGFNLAGTITKPPTRRNRIRRWS